MNKYGNDTQGPLAIPGYIDPDDVTIVQVIWGAPVWEASTIYDAGDVVRPTVANGYYYECQLTGMSGATEPVWAKKVTDNLTKFNAVAYNLFIRPGQSITASTWSATDSVTLASGAFTAETSTIMITVVPDGLTSFTLTNQVTANTGEKLSRSFLYTVNEQ